MFISEGTIVMYFLIYLTGVYVLVTLHVNILHTKHGIIK